MMININYCIAAFLLYSPLNKIQLTENTMKPIQFIAIFAGLLLARSVFAADAAVCTTEGYDHRQYEVFIDQPTGYSFIKTPCGWHFVRQIEREKVAAAIRASQRTPLTPTETDALVGLAPARPID
jgi:hypothetical protein